MTKADDDADGDEKERRGDVERKETCYILQIISLVLICC